MHQTVSIRSSKLPQSRRGDRLNPSHKSRLFWHLIQLRATYERLISEFRNEISNCTVVDYGCGNMPYRPLFESFASDYIGVDFADNELADKFLNEENVLPLEDASADMVLSSQVLEHVSSPENYLREAHRVLRPSGLLFLSTHGVWRYHPDPTDYWRWTCDGLKAQIQRSGFRLEAFSGVMGPEATALQLWQDAVLPRVPQRLKAVFIRYMQWRIQRADERCTAGVRDRDACVYVAVARKIPSGS